MVPLVFLVLLGVGLCIATYRDIKTREIPDTLSYGLIVLGLLGSMIYALATDDLSFFLRHLAGFGVGLVVGLVMFYGRQWGGGDAKLIMGVGAIFGFSMSDLSFVEFLILLILCGALYGIAMTLYLALIKHRKRFLPAFKTFIRTQQIHRLRIGLVATVLLCLIATFFVPWDIKVLLFLVMLGFYLLVYSYIFMKVVEQSILLKSYPVGKLTEGDWVAEDVKVGRKVIIKKNNTGITVEQIAQLKKARIKSVMVKEGIAFVPGFLLAFIVLVVFHFTAGEARLLALLVP